MTKKAAKRGRPCELTPEIVAEAAHLAPEVEYLETLAALLGIDRSTLNDWLKRGAREQRRRQRGQEPKDGEDLFVQSSHAIKKGRADSVQRSLNAIRTEADSGAWQAAAWRLERAYLTCGDRAKPSWPA